MECKKRSTTQANALLRQYSSIVPNPEFNGAVSLLKYLIQLDDISQHTIVRGTENWRYHSFDSILLYSGRFFSPLLTPGLKRTDLDSRFVYTANSQSKKNVYCEGVVLLEEGSLMEHAWLMDTESGEAIDKYFDGRTYFGIPLNPKFVNLYANTGQGVFSANEKSDAIELLIDGLPKNAIWCQMSG